jgi:phage repressor protein C with HTH and peptisase S24 domain
MLAESQQAVLQRPLTKGFVPSRLMKSMGERLRARRVQLRLSTPQLAAKVRGLGYRISHQAIQAIEAGGNTKFTLPIAKALEVSPDWLSDGTGPPPSPPQSINKQMSGTALGTLSPLAEPEKQVTKSPGDLFDVLGMVEGGPDGWNLWNGDVIETKRRPDNLLGVSGAYGVYIRGTSMEPELKHGWLLHIHPHKPAEPGDFVVVQRKPLHEGDPPLAVVKRLVRHSPMKNGKTILEQINPKKTFEVLNADLVSIHVVVGASW